MKFDPYDTLMINCGNSILIVFHLYCYSNHELSTMLIVIMFRTSKKLFTFIFLCILSLLEIMIGLPLWNTVGMNLAQ